MHAHDPRDLDLLVCLGVEDVHALFQLALVDADIGELAEAGLLELESKADEREGVV